MNPGLRLPDVNVLVPLLWPPHMHHKAAQDWFMAVRALGWATCPITQLGCVRVLANPAVSHGSLSVGSAVGLLREILSDAHHVFWPDDLAPSDALFAATLPHVQGHNQVTDRYLLALAASHSGVLATFDRSVGSGLPAASPLFDHLEIIET